MLLLSKGYTLIEVVVVAAVIAIVSTTAIANYGFYGRAQKLQLAAQIVASDIRLMQSHAFALKEISDPNDGGVMKVPAGGWGVFFQRQSPRDKYYRLCADISDENTCGSDNNDDELFRKILFNPPIEIHNIIVDGTDRNNAHIFFESPMSTSTICSTDCSGREAEIILTDDGGTTLKTIKVNIFGLVDID